MDIQYRLEQKRKVLADFPGPRSLELPARGAQAVAAGVASSVPVRKKTSLPCIRRNRAIASVAIAS